MHVHSCCEESCAVVAATARCNVLSLFLICIANEFSNGQSEACWEEASSGPARIARHLLATGGGSRVPSGSPCHMYKAHRMKYHPEVMLLHWRHHVAMFCLGGGFLHWPDGQHQRTTHKSRGFPSQTGNLETLGPAHFLKTPGRHQKRCGKCHGAQEHHVGDH